MNLFKKTAIAAGLAATALASTTPAMARDYHRGSDNTAAIAIGAGILGLAVGAIAASSNNHNDRYDARYDNRYSGPAYVNDWSYRDGYYWDRGGGRHDRDEYQRYYRGQGGSMQGDYRRGYDRSRDDYRRGY
ncbi:hypothetical protein [Novosphingobium sp. P6W]|uniref:hypothetical protein n=1 Tax=Novosphingobium sp. P6W TaxID=1609758 RepID=UPI0005C317D3|nr:hypothetical protein [Novosphingobium sp. P6W]AXB75801.1 hypothetical protein TQ38_004100 [Novosphingobium sp. P6W]KIS32991.1 hypothetical protein TQ38_05790 [Novosphingobium sp. P6W]